MSEFSLMMAFITMLMTLFVVLLESKFLAYAQSSMGPAVMGSNGLFQIILDLVKLVTKEIFLMPSPTTMLTPIFLSLLYSVQLSFSQNFIFGPNLFLFENVDSLILFHLILILLSNIFFVLVGLLTQSSYAMMGTVSSLVHILSLDIFMTILYSLLVFSSQSANFHDFVITQNIIWFFFLYLFLGSSFMMILLLESKSTPFDHAETESEVVAGYAVEYSGPMFMLMLLCEYLHLVISSMHFMIFFCGGWFIFNFFWFLPSFFLIPNNMNFWYDFFFNFISM